MIIIEDLSRLVSFTGISGVALLVFFFAVMHKKDRAYLGIALTLIYIGTLIPRIF